VLDADTAKTHLERTTLEADPQWAQADAKYQQAQAILKAERAKFEEAMKQDPQYVEARQAYDQAAAAVKGQEAALRDARQKQTTTATAAAAAHKQLAPVQQQSQADQTRLTELRQHLQNVQGQP